MQGVQPDVIYTREETQELLKVSRSTMTRLLNSGELEASKLSEGGRNWRIKGSDIIAFLEKRKVRTEQRKERG